MSEEYVWKESTGKMSVLDTKPNYNMTFHHDGKQIGVLDFNGPEMTFTGEADESAKVFFDWIARSFKARLGQEREAERETIIQAMPGGHSVDPQWVCDMIRARGNT